MAFSGFESASGSTTSPAKLCGHHQCSSIKDSVVCLQVGHVNCGIGFLCVVVREKSYIWQRPTKYIADDENGGILVIASYVGIVLTELGFLASGLSIPGEARFAVIARHVLRFVDEGFEVDSLPEAGDRVRTPTMEGLEGSLIERSKRLLSSGGV